MKEIFTIGHSTHSLETFISMLNSFAIELLVDIRSFPGSRIYPQFNKENLQNTIPEAGIEYIHLKELGGRRKVLKSSKNSVWRNDAFRGYADYMETHEFENAVNMLSELGLKKKTAYMCAESLWWRCHRSMVSDYLLNLGWEVHHITTTGKSSPHTFTQPAKIIDGKLSYRDEEDNEEGKTRKLL